MNEAVDMQYAVLPLIAGIPWLAGLIGGLFTSLFTWAAQYLTKRLARAVAVIGGIVTVTGAFYVAVQALMAGISYVMPAQVMGLAPILLPTNLDECLTALIAGRALRFAYSWSITFTQMKLF